MSGNRRSECIRSVVAALGLIAVLFAAAIPRAARADTLQSKIDPGLGQNVSVYYSGWASHGWSTTMTVYAGPYEATLDNWKSSFDAYCVDLDHWDKMPASYTVTQLSTDLLTTGAGGAANGPGIAWLYNTYQGTISDKDHGAALQLAIWELLTDGLTGLGLNTGSFKYTTSGNVLNYTQGYLDSWYNHGMTQQSTATWFKADHGPKDDINQNLVGPPSVPEPGSMALLAAGCLPLLRLRRRA